jgi:hypothetical protein
MPAADWQLNFQWCRYCHADGTAELGYRFIWTDAQGKLKPQRGQARIPSMRDLESLLAKAKQEGWGNYYDVMAQAA